MDAEQIDEGAAPSGLDDAAEEQASPIRSILMATDLSARSDRPLERALQLADQHRARLTILHVFDENLPDQVKDSVAAAAREDIEHHIEKAAPPADVDITIQVVPGKDYRDILRAVAVTEADLIVMGVHRNESGLKPITGTTMERVIRKGSRAVLVVPDRVKGPYNRLMMGLDFSVYSRFALRGALGMAPGAELHAVHAFKIPFETVQPGREALLHAHQQEDKKLTAFIAEEFEAISAEAPGAVPDIESIQKVVRHGETQAVLRAEAERITPDLMVLGTHGRVGLSRAVLGSVAEKFLNRPVCDVLVIKAW
ncbi:MAG: universal stress protein [Alphaproteobacteria bacterium]